MLIAFGADHAGWELKEHLKAGGRHQRRLDKMTAIEQRHLGQPSGAPG